MDAAISMVTRGVLILLGVLTAWDYALHRDAQHRDAFFLFGSLGGAVLVPLLAGWVGAPAQPTGIVAVILILAEPYFWLRVVQHHRHVPRIALWIAAASMVGTSLAYAVGPTPAPLPVTLFLVVYMGTVGIYGSALLIRGARQEHGLLRRRLTLGAWGSILLGVALLFAGVRAAVPALPPVAATLSSLVSLTAVLAFYAAFAPPGWIRESWAQLRLAGQVVPILLVTAGLTGLFTAVTVASALRGVAFDEVRRSQIMLAQSSADTIGQLLNGALGSVRQAAGDSSTRRAFEEPRDLAVVNEKLAGLLERTAFASTTFALDANGTLLMYLPKDPSTFDQSLIGRDFSSRDYFQGAMSTRAPFVTGAFVSAIGATFAIAAPVFGSNGEIRAVVGATFDPGYVGELLRPKGAAPDTRLVVTTSGLIAIHPQPERLSLPIEEESPWAASWTGGPSAVVEVSPLGGNERLVAHAPVGDHGWAVLISTPTESIFAPVDAATRQAVGWVLVCTVLLSAIGALAAGMLFRPLRSIALASSRLGAGDYATRMAVQGATDLREVAREFNRMADALATKDAQLLRRNEELEEQYRRVQEASRLKGEFLANMSHELRTPLNGIIGFAELMHDERVGPISPDHKEYLGDILTSANHLLQLINDVLDLSKVESGKMDFHPEPVALSRIVGEVSDVLRTLLAGKRIQLSVDIDPEVESVVADPARLKQILYNYLSNAIKFTPNEGRVSIQIKPEGSSRYRLAVTDTGIGIPADQQYRLFVEFQQLDSTVAKKYQGTGLGLALTKRLAEAQGGSVGVDSTPGVGSTFYAVLPRVMRALEDIEPAISFAPESDGAGPSVLVVDDNPSDCEWLERVLSQAGYGVTVAGSGAEALRLCHQRVFDAITLDLLLPDLPGPKVLQRIRTETANADTPVVVVTVMAQADLGLGFAIQDYLIKPVKDDDLLTALARGGVKSSEKGKILVVDDDATVRSLLEVTLRAAGFEAICVAGGKRGLEVAAGGEISAVVLDLLMPEMDGFEFLHRLRRTPEGRHTPVVVLTAKDLTNEDRRRLESTTQAVVPKGNGGSAGLLAELEAWISRAPTAPGRSEASGS